MKSVITIGLSLLLAGATLAPAGAPHDLVGLDSMVTVECADGVGANTVEVAASECPDGQRQCRVGVQTFCCDKDRRCCECDGSCEGE